MKSRPYLEYLQKEMAIMGILSAFMVVFAGLVFDRAISAKLGSILATMWVQSGALISTAVVSAVISALFFYLQRSLLAWFYGQITLSEIRNDSKKVEELLTDADSWPSWARYQFGFVALYLSFILIGMAILRLFSLVFAEISLTVLLAPSVIIAIAYGCFIRYLLYKYPNEEDYPLVIQWRKWKGKLISIFT